MLEFKCKKRYLWIVFPFQMISQNRKNVEVVGVDYDIVMDYTARRSPVFVEIDGRAQISNACL